MNEIKAVRQSNFELLRIICMLLIVGHHIAMHGNYPAEQTIAANVYVVRFFAIGGKLGVNLFVLISGYFMVNSKFRINKLLRLFAQIWFYSILIFALLLILGKVEYSHGLLLNAIFPVSTNAWWFITTYVILYCLSPFLNILIKHCPQKWHLFLIIFLVVLQCAMQFAFRQWYISNVGWFVTLYLIAAYIRLYPHKLFDSNKIALPISLSSFVIIAVFNMLWKINLWDMTNIVCLVWSVATFCAFKNFRIPNNKVINTVAKTTLGIYLIHDHGLIRGLLWNELLKSTYHYQQNTFVCYAAVAVLTVFAACMIIDLLRELLFASVNKLIKLITLKIKDK